jgi:hypothetical protein
VLDGDTLNYEDDGAAPPAKRERTLPSKAGAKMASRRDDALDSDALDYEDDGAAPPAKHERASSFKVGAKARTVKRKADSVSNESSANTEQRKKLRSSAR